MTRFLNYIIILSLSLFVFGCTSYEESYLEKALAITGESWYNGACRVGVVTGEASFQFYPGYMGQVCVDYRVLGRSARECGGLRNLKLVDDGKNDTYSIEGDWYPKGSGSGRFHLMVYGEEAPNTIYMDINGSNFKYWANMELSEEKFLQYITLMKRASEEEPNSDESIEENDTDEWLREMDEEEKELFRQYD